MVRNSHFRWPSCLGLTALLLAWAAQSVVAEAAEPGARERRSPSASVPAGSNRPAPEQALGMADPPATREFSIKDDRPYLGGRRIDIWGLRCGNALFSQGVTERHVRNLDNMVAHGYPPR